MDAFKTWFPNITSAQQIKRVTNYRGLYEFKESMPWPIWPRQLLCEATGVFEEENLAVLTVLRSVPLQEEIFGHTFEKVESGHVELLLRKGYHYFEYIDDETTKYVMIFNSDPQLGLVP